MLYFAQQQDPGFKATHSEIAHRKSLLAMLWVSPCRPHSTFTSQVKVHEGPYFCEQPLLGLPIENPYRAPKSLTFV